MEKCTECFHHQQHTNGGKNENDEANDKDNNIVVPAIVEFLELLIANTSINISRTISTPFVRMTVCFQGSTSMKGKGDAN